MKPCKYCGNNCSGKSGDSELCYPCTDKLADEIKRERGFKVLDLEFQLSTLQAENKRLREEINIRDSEIFKKEDANVSLCRKVDNLKSDLAEAVKALELVKARGYNEDCIFCGLKDRVVKDFLEGNLNE